MYWQREVLRDAVSMTFGQTFELDLPKNGRLGSLLLYVSSTQNGQPFLTAVKWRLIDYISKIEVIGDGSTVIKSFDGRQALASAYFDQGLLAPSMWRHYSNTPHRQFILVNFGRFLHDELLALDLSRFNQVELKITNDASATEFTTDIKVTVMAYWMREAVGAVQGHLCEEEWRPYAPVAGAWEYNDLPTSLPIRRILLRGRPAVDTADAKNNSSLHRLLDDIEFTLRTGQVRVYRGSGEMLGHASVLEMGFQQDLMGYIDRTDEYGFEAGMGYTTQNLGAPGTYTAAPAAFPNTVMSNDVQDSAQELHAREADSPLVFLVRGHGLMHNIPLFFARKPDMSDLLDPDKEKTVKVDIQCRAGTTVAGTADNAENCIILSRLVR